MKNLPGRAIILSALLTFFIPQVLSAGWMRTYGAREDDDDMGYYVQLTSDGGYVITGWTLNPALHRDVYVVKTDPLGDTLWTRIYDGGGHDEGVCIQETSDGNYVIAGHRGFTPDLWLLKLDTLGDTLWTRTYGDAKPEVWDKGYYVIVLEDGSLVITGETGFSTEGGEKKVWLLKVDSSGDTLWTRTYGLDTGWDFGECVEQTTDGGFIITGYTQSFGDAQSSIWLLKTDSLGDTLWTKAYGGIIGNGSWGKSVQQTTDGGFIITGLTGYVPYLKAQIWLIKTDSMGDTLWSKLYDLTPAQERAESVRQTSDGGYIVVGVKNYSLAASSAADLWLLRTDSSGDTLWTRTYGGESLDWGRCVQLTPDGGYIITGNTASYPFGQGHQVLLIKTDSLGYVGLAEPVTHPSNSPDLETSAPVGKPVEIRYTDMPGGFHAWVFDVTGRKVDEVHSTQTQGTITWGESHGPGVYFIRETLTQTTHRVVLVR